MMNKLKPSLEETGQLRIVAGQYYPGKIFNEGGQLHIKQDSRTVFLREVSIRACACARAYFNYPTLLKREKNYPNCKEEKDFSGRIVCRKLSCNYPAPSWHAEKEGLPC